MDSATSDLPCTCFRLRGATRRLTRRYDRALRPAGIRINQYSVLAHLARDGDRSMTGLARALATDRTTLTRNLGPLEAAGWVDVSDGPDLRTRSVSITAAGRAKFEQAMPLWREAQRAVKRALGPGDLALLHDLLGRAARA